ncbi:MAG: methyltransferase [Candidatus Latescibacterota bacterium]|jgi:hypothetical protein
MLDGQPGSAPDPYVFYKMHHVDRARRAWALSEELGLYEALRDGPLTLAELCARTGLQGRPARVLLWANAWLGIIGQEQDRYFLYEIMREFVLAGGRARTEPRIPADRDYELTRRAFQTGEPEREDMPLWLADPHAVPPDATAFAPSRHGWRILWGEALAQAFDFGPYRCVADLGAATGGVLVGLTGKCPHLQGIVVDLPYSRSTAEAAIAQSGAADRVRFYAADFFIDPYPAEVDVFFMSHVIHDWDDARCLTILTRCREALPAGSPVLVQEYLLNEARDGSLLAVFQSFGLMSGTYGIQRTAGEIAALMVQVGLGRTETRPLDHEQSLVIGWKPG